MVYTLLVLCLVWLFEIVFLRSAYSHTISGNLTRIATAIEQQYLRAQSPLPTDANGQPILPEEPQQPEETVDYALPEETIAYLAEEDVCVRVYLVTADLQELANDHNDNDVYSIDVREMRGSSHVCDDKNYCALHNPQVLPGTFFEYGGRNQVICDVLLSQPAWVNDLTIDNREYLVNITDFALSTPNQYIVIFSNSPLETIDTTTNLLVNQMWVITIFVVVLGMVVAVIIAARISNPIVRTTQTAKKLAEGQFDVHFEPGNLAEINQLSETLNYAARGLSEVDRLRQELIANVSHDLRTPLTMIRAYAEMLGDFSWEHEERRNEHIGIIINEVDRLSKLVRDLLSLSQLQTQREPFEEAPFDVVGLVSRVCTTFKPLIEQKQITLQQRCPDHMVIYGNEDRIEQVVYNLLSNALQYTPEGGEVTVIVTRRLNDWVRVSIVDTGCGIPDDELPYIWDRYNRTREQRSKSGGTGLGLSIVKAILTGSQARFGAISRVNVGSTFWFELPTFPRGKQHTAPRTQADDSPQHRKKKAERRKKA